MARVSRAEKYGNYICRVNDYDIRKKTTWKRVDPSQRGVKKKRREAASHEYILYRGKKSIEGGFKTREQAEKRAMEL